MTSPRGWLSCCHVLNPKHSQVLRPILNDIDELLSRSDRSCTLSALRASSRSPPPMLPLPDHASTEGGGYGSAVGGRGGSQSARARADNGSGVAFTWEGGAQTERGRGEEELEQVVMLAMATLLDESLSLEKVSAKQCFSASTVFLFGLLFGHDVFDPSPLDPNVPSTTTTRSMKRR